MPTTAATFYFHPHVTASAVLDCPELLTPPPRFSRGGIRLGALRETITLYPVAYTGAADRYNNPGRVEAPGVTTPAALTPFRLADEKLAAEDWREIRYKVIVPPCSDIDGLGRVVWKGVSYEVFGEVQTYSTRIGVHHHEFIIKKIEGA